jgi:IS5 family transposase
MSKDKYKVTNWSSYNKGLKQRGSITLWISSNLSEQWKWAGASKRGGQYAFSDVAIELCLTIGKVYGLALRQTEGFIGSFFDRCGWSLAVPCYTTLCRRGQRLGVNLKSKPRNIITNIVVDSTGLKVYGEGEWKVRKHGAGKRRTWMKLHIALDEDSQQIEAVSLTSNGIHDSTEVPKLLNQIKQPIGSFKGDGAYDKDNVRKELTKRGIAHVIPPQHNAVMSKTRLAHRRTRDEDIKMIAHTDRTRWKVQSGYHQRSKAETVMFRYKTIIGNSLSARKIENQETEIKIGCKILNTMLQLNKPISIKIT